MDYQILPMIEAYAKTIVNWVYDPPFSIYNMDGTNEAVEELLTQNYYAVLNEFNDVFGFYCIGESAQVPIGDKFNVYDDRSYLDIGLGLNPKYVGKGMGEEFINLGILYFENKYQNKQFRLTVLDFNERAIHLYQKIGFKTINYFKAVNSRVFIVMHKN